MPRLTITLDGKTADLPDAVVPRLQVLCDRTNAAQKTPITLLDWLELNLKELAVADDLAAAIRQLQEQQQADAQATLETAIKTARDQLIASLNNTTAAGGQPG